VEGFEPSIADTQKVFFPQGQWNRFAIENQGKPHMINEHCDRIDTNIHLDNTNVFQ